MGYGANGDWTGRNALLRAASRRANVGRREAIDARPFVYDHYAGSIALRSSELDRLSRGTQCDLLG